VTVARTLEAALGPDLPIAVRAYDRSRVGPTDAPATLLIRSPNVFRRLLTAPDELGLGRAYVAGELEVEGDLYAALDALCDRIPDLREFGARQ
jgi:cyclopropane-fatty-acyl-phospholipid synthase